MVWWGGGEAQTLSDPQRHPERLQVLQAESTPAAAAGSTPTFITIMRAVRRLRCVEKGQNVWESRTCVASGTAGSRSYVRPAAALRL